MGLSINIKTVLKKWQLVYVKSFRTGVKKLKIHFQKSFRAFAVYILLTMKLNIYNQHLII